MFLPISTHFTATLGIPLTSPALKPDSIQSNSHLKSRTFTPDLPSRLRALYAQLFRTTLAPYVLPRLLARSLPGLPPWIPSSTRLQGQEFTIRKPSSSTRRCWVRVPPIAQYSPLLPPVGVWAVSQSQCGRSPSQVGYRSSAWWAVTSPTT